MVRPLLAVACMLCLGACRTGGAANPTAAADAYARALRAGDYDRAYALMSDTYRREHPKEEFVRNLQASPDEVKETAARLTAPGRRVAVSAQVTYGTLGDELRLVREDGGWRIAEDPLSFYPQDTPGRTLRSFLRAVELGRYDVVMRFVPSSYKKYMSEDEVKAEFEGERREEIAARLRLLKANLDAPIQEEGDTARMAFGDHQFEVEFVREDGLWKIEDLY